MGKIGVLTAEPAASPPTGNGHAGQAIGTEKVFAEVLHVERVPVDSHFFDDLGADSMVMAQFCARVRKRADLPSDSMKDVYQHPTISSLATAFTDAAPAPAEPAPPSVDVPAPSSRRATAAAPRHR